MADDFTRPYGKGLYVDIFPMMPYPSVSKSFIRRVARGYCRANAILCSQHYYSWRSVAELFYFGMKRTWCKWQWRLACLFRMKGEYTSNTLNNNGYGIMHRTDSIFPTRRIRFEDVEFSAPANLTLILPTSIATICSFLPKTSVVAMPYSMQRR